MSLLVIQQSQDDQPTRVLLVTLAVDHAAATRSRDALVSRGYTVDLIDEATAVTMTPATVSATYGVVATVRTTYRSTTVRDWLRGVWAVVPVLFGPDMAGSTNGSQDSYLIALGVVTEVPYIMFGRASIMERIPTHPITQGYGPETTANGYATVLTDDVDNYNMRDRQATAPVGTSLGYTTTFPEGHYFTAIETTVAVKDWVGARRRGVFCGWLYAGQANYTADGAVLLGQSLAWLMGANAAAATPTPAATPATLGTATETDAAPAVVTQQAAPAQTRTPGTTTTAATASPVTTTLTQAATLTSASESDTALSVSPTLVPPETSASVQAATGPSAALPVVAVVGGLTVEVGTATGTSTANGVFGVVARPPARPTPGSDLETGVIRWIFEDIETSTQVTLPMNPKEMSTPYNSRQMTFASGGANGETRIRGFDAGPSSPVTWTFSGSIYVKSHYDLLLAWAARLHVLHITDHLERTFEVIIQTFDPIEPRRSINRPWRANYTMTCLLLEEIK